MTTEIHPWIGFRILLGVLVGSMAIPSGAADLAPYDRFDQAWKIQSFLSDAGLKDQVVFNLDFNRVKTGPRRGMMWLATSDGLHEYDGYAWRRYVREQGLPSDFVRSVLVTREGVLWVGTDRGAGVYDGKTFQSLGSETGLAGPNVRRILEDRDGGIWFCCDSWPNAGTPGGLTSYKGGVWKTYRRADGLPSDYVLNYFQSQGGRTFAATLEGIVEREGDRWVQAIANPTDRQINWGSASFAEAKTPGLVCSSGRDLFTWRRGEWRLESARMFHEHGVIATEDGALIAVGLKAARRGTFVEWRSNDWVRVSAEFPMPDDFVMDIREAPDGGVWAMGMNCLVRWARRGGQWSEYPRLEEPQLMDPEGAIWFAQRTDVYQPGARPVRFNDGDWRPGMERSRGLRVAGDGAVWGWSDQGATRWATNQTVEFSLEQVGVATNNVLRVDGKGKVWIVGSDSEGVPVVSSFERGEWQPRKLPDWQGRRMWRAVEPGQEGIWIVADTGRLTAVTLRQVGGTDEQQIPIPEVLVDVYSSDIHVDRQGSIWLFGDTGLFRWRLGKSEVWEPVSGLPGRQVSVCIERGEELWVACRGRTGGSNGLARLRDGVWRTYPVENQGELSVAHDGTLVWPADGRFYYLMDHADALPVGVDMPEKIAVRTVLKARDGAYWIRAGTGVFRFAPDGIPPETRIGGPDRVMGGDRMEVTAEGIDRFRPKGYRTDHRFSWRMDGGKWTEPVRDRFFSQGTGSLGFGLHRLEVRCIDAGGDVDSTPAELSFDVLPPPLQRRAWFLPVVGGVCVVLLALTGVTIRARRRLAEHARVLERRVTERTSELTRDVAQRRMAEFEAKEGRERLATMFQASPSLMGIASYPDGCFIEVNRCFIETLGYTVGDMVGRTGSEAGIWARSEQRDALWADLRGDAPVRNRELLIRAKSGRIHTVLASVDRIELGGKPALLFAASDITDRVRIERRRATEHAVARVLAEARAVTVAIPAVLKAIVESEGWALAELWEVEGTEERLHRVAVWHGGDDRFAEWASTAGVPKIGPGEGLAGIVWQAAGPVFISDLANDIRFRRGDAASRAGLVAGVGLPIRAAGRVTGVLILLADRAVNPGQDFEEALGTVGSQIGQFIARSRTRDELERFVAMSPTVLYVLQIGPSSLVTSWVSSNVTSMLGYRSEECLTPGWWARTVHPDDLKRTVDAQPSPYQIDHLVSEYRVRRKDGVYIWIRDEKRLVRDSRGHPKEVVGSWADVSERVALEARLIQAQKMEAIGLLSGGIAHDFNNILGAILGNAQLARMDVSAEHPAAESLDAIVQATGRAKTVVRQILDFARQESQELRRMALGPVAHESVRLLRATLPAEVQLSLEVAPELPWVLADASQIQQAVLNLGTNAWHALGDRPGKVEILLSAEQVDEATAGRNPDLRVGRYVRLRVRDSGKGMTREIQEQIFMPFFTTKPPGTGTGLGLSVVHGIVKDHRGAILVTSSPGRGATFDLYFPSATGLASETVAPSGGEAPKGGNERVLLVDDKELIVRSCSRALSRLGYQVKSFTDGASALAELHGNTHGYDLVITDLSMPGISGLEIARIIQKIRPDLPVVLSSGMVPAEMQNELTAAGVYDVLRKPFTFEELGETVARAIRRNAHESTST